LEYQNPFAALSGIVHAITDCLSLLVSVSGLLFGHLGS